MSLTQAELDARCGTNAQERARMARGEPSSIRVAQRRLFENVLGGSGGVGGFGVLSSLRPLLFLGFLVFFTFVVTDGFTRFEIPVPVLGGFVFVAIFMGFVLVMRRRVRIHPVRNLMGGLVTSALDAPVRVEVLEVRLITELGERTTTHSSVGFGVHVGGSHSDHGHHRDTRVVPVATLLAEDGRYFEAPMGLANVTLEGRYRVYYSLRPTILGIASPSAGHVEALEPA